MFRHSLSLQIDRWDDPVSHLTMFRVVVLRSEPALRNHVEAQGQAHGIAMAYPRCGQLALSSDWKVRLPRRRLASEAQLFAAR